MSRAAPLPPSERRQAIIDAATPLLLRQGAAATSTRQIAEACGIAEGTIFRVFDSKDDLIQSCLTEALSISHLTRELDAAASDDLSTTTTRLLAALRHHLDYVRALTTLFGHPPIHQRHHGEAKADGSSCPRPDLGAMREEINTHVADVLAPHADALAATPRLAASYLIAVSFGAHHPMGGSPDLADPALLARLALSGLTQEA